jgi:hypothetical protein
MSKNSSYLFSPAFDYLFIILAPLIAYLVGIGLFSFVGSDGGTYEWLGGDRTFLANLTTLAIQPHLIIGFVRSYNNPALFNRFRMRLIVVPAVLLSLICTYDLVFLVFAMIVVGWDAWHSSMQTFGFGRIYDQRAGHLLEEVRHIDLITNGVIYLGPFLGGVMFLQQVSNSLSHPIRFYPEIFGKVQECVILHSESIRFAVAGVSLTLMIYCVSKYIQLARLGYRMPLPKLVLIISTALATCLSWGLNSFGEAYFAMNLFHSIQYFAIVWWAEKLNLRRLFGPAAFLILISFGLSYGVLMVLHREELFMRVSLSVAILHFWTDGFIWSVRSQTS